MAEQDSGILINGSCMYCPPSPTRTVRLLSHLLDYASVGASELASFILMLILMQHLWKCVARRLWLFPCYPSQFLSLSAGMLALVSISAKSPSLHSSGGRDEFLPWHYNLMGSILVYVFVAACMPSIAAIDRSQMWSNIAGTALLLMAIIFNVLYYGIYKETGDHPRQEAGMPVFGTVAACLGLLIFVIILQASLLDVMMSDVVACSSIRLQQLEIGANHEQVDPNIANCNVQVRERWKALERKACMKLMVGLTSNPQNVASRSPSSAMLMALILVSTGISSRALCLNHTPKYLPLITANVIMFGIMCVSRWLMLVICDDRLPMSLFVDTHPFFCREKVTSFWLQLKDGPPPPLQPSTCQRMTYLLRSMLYFIAAMILLPFFVPIHWILLALMRFLHSGSALLVRMSKTPLRMLIYFLSLLPGRALSLCIEWMLMKCQQERLPSPAHLAPHDADLAAGVVYIAGEDAGIVQKLFEGSARHMIQRQIKKAEKKSTKALETLLRSSKEACFFRNTVLYEILEQRGMPDVGMLHVGQYGDQYGWSLTVLSLLEVMHKVEVEALGTDEVSVVTMEAYKEAVEMVKVVDEWYAPTVCSKETYVRASASVWLSVLKKSSSRQKVTRQVRDVNVVVDILDATLEDTMRQLKESVPVEFPWAMEVVRAYTMYTVCQNLRRWLMDVERAGSIAGREEKHGSAYTCVLEHIRFLVAEVLAGCMCALPAVLEARLSRAVESGEVDDIENAIFLIQQGQKLWEKLEWPVMYYEGGLQGRGASATSFSLTEYWLQHQAADVNG